MKLILGSQSARRKEILSFFNLPFAIAKPTFDEKSLPYTGSIADYVCVLAQKKNETLLPSDNNTAILTADTLVYSDGQILGKPKDENEAFDMLKQLSGRWHSVVTGLTLSYQGLVTSQSEETRVLFNTLTTEHIKAYHSKINWSDKAGAYAIQDGGALIVKKIDGCFYNVMGLPINTLNELLKKANIDLWEYIN